MKQGVKKYENSDDSEAKEKVNKDVIEEENDTEGGSDAQEKSNSGKHVWSTEATQVLLQLYQEYEPKFLSPKLTNKSVWKMISGKMKELGHDFCHEQCNSKFKNLKKTYRTIVESQRRNGRSTARWQYFEIMEDLFPHTPELSPYNLSSNSKGFVSLKRPGPLSSNFASLSRFKRRALPLSRSERQKEPIWVKTMRADLERRHEEKMTVARELVDVLKSLVPKD